MALLMAALAFLPNTVKYETSVFVNPQGLKLQSYRFRACQKRPQAVVFMCHGYTAHTIFEWLVASEPGGLHDCWDNSVLQGLVQAGFAVHALDQQGHGQSEGARGLRCFFESFSHLPMENEAYIREVVLKDSEMHGLPLFLFGISMGGATAVRMHQLEPTAFSGMVLYSPMLSLELVRKERVACCIRNAHLEPFAACMGSCMPTLPIAKAARNLVSCYSCL